MPPLLDHPTQEGLVSMDAKTFGARLREMREKAGLTQKELAEKTGIGQASISSWEQGLREPLIGNVPILAEALGVEPSEFFTPPDTTETASRGRPGKSLPPAAKPKRKPPPGHPGRKGP
jgi:transcriptional regulator with XRE-family HTH domain